MKTLALALAVAAGGCLSGDDAYVVATGGDPPTETGSTPGQIAGRVCVVTDLRDLEACAELGASDLIVTLGDAAATTEADGTFVIDVPPDVVSAENPTITVSGAIVAPTTFRIDQPFGSVGLIPAVDADVFARVLTSNGALLEAGAGTVLATVRTPGGLPVTGVTVSSSPVSQFGPFFDGQSPLVWTVTETGAAGVALVPGVASGNVDLSLAQAASGVQTTVAGVPVRSGGVTIVGTTFPVIP